MQKVKLNVIYIFPLTVVIEGVVKLKIPLGFLCSARNFLQARINRNTFYFARYLITINLHILKVVAGDPGLCLSWVRYRHRKHTDNVSH